MPTFDASTNPERIPFVEVLMALCDLAKARGVEIVLVGATARDIALAAEGHDAPLRATNDVDIAVAVADAAAFERLVADLAPVPASGAHKFLINGIEVDIVPFGGIEREDRTVVWPDGSTMNTLGFAESLESALELVLPGGRRMRGPRFPPRPHSRSSPGPTVDTGPIEAPWTFASYCSPTAPETGSITSMPTTTSPSSRTTTSTSGSQVRIGSAPMSGSTSATRWHSDAGTSSSQTKTRVDCRWPCGGTPPKTTRSWRRSPQVCGPTTLRSRAAQSARRHHD